jgi:hypothetical protein
MFTREDYDQLHAVVFRDGYPGYKPEVKEIPNGDGKVDETKRYAHVAPKYITDDLSFDDSVRLTWFHHCAFQLARDIAVAAGITEPFLPDRRYGALRVLEYPPGAISNSHKDFDLFTLMMFREQPDRFVAEDHDEGTDCGVEVSDTLLRIRQMNTQAHLGELGEEIEIGYATPHHVLPSDVVQRAIVYFAIPDHDAVLPSGVTVRDWLNERMARSRTSFEPYERPSQ